MIRLFLIFNIFLLFTELNAEKLPVGKDYELEIADPYHRHIHILSPIHTLWENSWKSTNDNFWDFLEQERSWLEWISPALYESSYHMVWLEDDAAKIPFATSFHQDAAGDIVISTPAEGLLPDGKWMYVQMDDTFLLAREKKFQFHHTSLSAGQPVDSAGTFTIKGGKLHKISLVSGHYRPKVIHGHYCLQKMGEQGLDLAGLQITYCVVQEGIVIKRKVSIEDFLSSASDDPDPSVSTFFKPLSDFDNVAVDKAELFQTTSGQLWIGNSKLDENDPLCSGQGPFYLISSVKLKEGKITHVIFNTQIDLPIDIERMQSFVIAMIDHGIEVEDISFRIIRNHEKEVVSYTDILEMGLP